MLSLLCPIHFQCFFLISPSTKVRFVLFHSRLLLIVSGKRFRGILCRQLLINTCIFWMMAPYNRTVFIFVLVLVDSCFEFQMFFNCKYVALALMIRAFTFALDPPCSSMLLSRYVEVFTSSKPSPSCVIRLMHVVLCRRALLFPSCMLRPTAATLVVFSCICCCACDRRARSSGKFRSSSCILVIHCIPCCPQMLMPP
ncbi:unnamed protein product [Schistosoma rodhaini]|uniref:Uncharacterized protein n=1 Tax=Schistosoma rodhaini TaxID=6188 RepID=A0AA85GIG7_9TREM|nr:unnamed protein product [Schistosoma rodhaini]